MTQLTRLRAGGRHDDADLDWSSELLDAFFLDYPAKYGREGCLPLAVLRRVIRAPPAHPRAGTRTWFGIDRNQCGTVRGFWALLRHRDQKSEDSSSESEPNALAASLLVEAVKV
jgi:hypothetical protein